jgi:uncharacterized protein involved in exopolysaccharide biosynthesis
MNASQRPVSSGPGGFLEALRGRWQIAPGLAALGLLAAAAYVLVVPRVYTATSAVRPTAAPGGRIILLPVQVPVPGLGGDAQAAGSAGVAAMAGKMLHSRLSPLALSKQITVTVRPGSGVLGITCAASSASGAASCANAFAKAYLQDRGAAAAASLNAQLHVLQGKITALQKTVSMLNTKISGLPSNAPARINDQATAASDTAQLQALNQRLASLTVDLTNTSGGHIVTAASPPGTPASPDKTLVLPGGLAAGLLLGLIAEFWLDRRDKRIRSIAVPGRNL